MVMLSTICVSASPQDRSPMLRSLRSTLGPTGVRNGCLSCRLYQDVQDEGKFALISRWRNREDIDGYLHSDQFRTVLSVVDLSSKTPEIQFDRIEETSGFELLAAAQ